MWGHRNWKEKMERAVNQAILILTANSALQFDSACKICPNESFCKIHLLGPKHFNNLMKFLPETKPVDTAGISFPQEWLLGNAKGKLLFHHATGTLHMVRFTDGSNEAVAQAFTPAPAATGQSTQFFNIYDDEDDIQARVAAAVSVVRQPSTPLPSVQEEPSCASSSHQRGTSSTVAPLAADTQLASWQQQSATSGSTRDKVFSPWGDLPPAKLGTRTKPHTISTQQPPVWGSCAFQWVWRQQAAREVTRLADMLDDAFGSTMHHYCQLCRRSIVTPESFVKHVSTDQGHMEMVQARFVDQGPSWRGWMQCWGSVAALNHLTLNVSAGEPRARGVGSEVGTAQPQPLLPQPPPPIHHQDPHVPRRPPGAPPGREQPTQMRSVAEFNHLDVVQPQPLLPQPQLQQPTEGLIDDYPRTPPPPPNPPPGWPADPQSVPAAATQWQPYSLPQQ
jgi:hypothetical protein